VTQNDRIDFSAHWFRQLDYRLALAANEPGVVCFVLTREEGH